MKSESLDVTGEVHAAVYGRPGGADFVVVILPFGKSSVLALEYAEANALPFCGTLHFVRGECQAKCEPSAEAVSVLMDAAPHFAQYVASKVRHADRWSELT